MHSSKLPLPDELGSRRCCMYAGVCKYYRLADATCNSGEDSEQYCSTFDIFENFKVRKHEELGQ